MDLGRFAMQSPVVNESMSRGQGAQNIECPYCKRMQHVPAGMVIRSMVADRKTFCHDVIDKRGNIIERATLL
jgi:hypothetical protein